MPSRRSASKLRPFRHSPRSRILPQIAAWYSLSRQYEELTRRLMTTEAQLPGWAISSPVAISLNCTAPHFPPAEITERNIDRVFGTAWRSSSPELHRLKAAARAELSARQQAVAAERARLGVDELHAALEKIEVRLERTSAKLEAAEPATPGEAAALCRWMLDRIGLNAFEDQTITVPRAKLTKLKAWLNAI